MAEKKRQFSTGSGGPMPGFGVRDLEHVESYATEEAPDSDVLTTSGFVDANYVDSTGNV